MQLDVFDTIEAIRTARSHWDALVSRMGRPIPNVDYARFVAVNNALDGARPYLLLARHAGQPMGALIARRTERHTAFRVGYFQVPAPRLRYLEVVYGGLIGTVNPEVCETLTNHIKMLLSHGTVDVVTVNHLALGDPAYSVLRDAGALQTASEPHHEFLLAPGAFEETLARFSKKHRYNIRRAVRVFHERFRDDVLVKRVTEQHQIEEFLAMAVPLTRRTYQGRLQIGLADSTLWRAILNVEAHHGRLLCYVLQGGGQVIAHQVGCVYGQTYFLEATSFSPEYRDLSPGQVLLLKVFQDLREHGIVRVDYGFGDADYKRIYGSRCEQECTLSFYSRSLRGRLGAAVEHAGSHLRALGRAVAPCLGGVARVKASWRRYLSSRASG